eukprot:9318623-Pyramimonas_sp.AAC.1
MTSWPKLRETLHMWSERRPSDVHGCLDVADPVHWHGLIPLLWAPQTRPAFRLIQAMRDAGWSAGKPSHHPLPIADKK